MKMMKIALIASAAVAAGSLSARADELSDLKAQIEALNNRVATMEAAPAVPAGYQLLSISEGKAMVVPGVAESDKSYGDTATIISVLPTADAPAEKQIDISGFARAALVYVDSEGSAGANGDDDIDVAARGEVKIQGKTDTAVGEVGAFMKLRASFDTVNAGNGDVVSPEYWGWWAMTEELTLGGGFSGTLANIGYGYDGACNCYYTDNADVAFNPGDTAQMRLSYASGPMSFAIAIEDGSADGATDDSMGFAAELKYAGDMVSLEVAGGFWDDDDWVAGADDAREWQVGVGAGFNLEMFEISLALATGENFSGSEFWGGSILARATLSDSVKAEIAYGHKDYKGADNVDAVLAGIYYEPVSQLTIGLEGEWIDDSDESMQVDLVTVYRF